MASQKIDQQPQTYLVENIIANVTNNKEPNNI